MSASVIGVGSRMIGVPGRPMSPENTTIVSRPPVGRAIRIRTIAEPRMWPASASVTWTPCATSCSMPYGIVLNIDSVRSTSSSVYSGSPRWSIDLRAGRAQQLLGVGTARALGALGRQVQDLVVRRALVALGVAWRPGRGRGARVGRPAWRTRSGAWPSRAARGARARRWPRCTRWRRGSPRGRAAAAGRSGRGGRG